MKGVILLCFLGLAASTDLYENMVKWNTHEYFNQGVKDIPDMSSLMKIDDPLVKKMDSELKTALIVSVETQHADWLSRLSGSMKEKEEALQKVISMLKKQNKAAQKGQVASKEELKLLLKDMTKEVKRILATDVSAPSLEDMAGRMQQDLYKKLRELQSYAQSRDVTNPKAKDLREMLIGLNEEQLKALASSMLSSVEAPVSGNTEVLHWSMKEFINKILGKISALLKNQLQVVREVFDYVISKIGDLVKSKNAAVQNVAKQFWEKMNRMRITAAEEILQLLKNYKVDFDVIWKTAAKELLYILLNEIMEKVQ